MSAGRRTTDAGPVSADTAEAPQNASAPTQDASRSTSVPVLSVVAPDASRCDHCGGPLPPPADRRGLRRRFCRSAHCEAARLRRERGLPEDYPTQANRHGRRRLGAGRGERS